MRESRVDKTNCHKMHNYFLLKQKKNRGSVTNLGRTVCGCWQVI